jgi:hypothetical protein
MKNEIHDDFIPMIWNFVHFLASHPRLTNAATLRHYHSLQAGASGTYVSSGSSFSLPLLSFSRAFLVV